MVAGGALAVATASLCAQLLTCPSQWALCEASALTWSPGCPASGQLALPALQAAAQAGVLCPLLETSCAGAPATWTGEAAPAPRALKAAEADEHEPLTPLWWTNIGLTVLLVAVSGTMAGLTMGFVSMDPTYIQILISSGTPEQQAMAKAVKPFVDRHHLTLVTLLLGNASANEALPLVTDQLLPSWGAIILSVTAVLIFAEILPSSIFTGPSQLAIAARLTWLMYIVVVLMYPVAAPIAALLDWWLGHDHGLRFQRHELKEFIRLHAVTAETAGQQGEAGPDTGAPTALGPVTPVQRSASDGDALERLRAQAPQSVFQGSGSIMRPLGGSGQLQPAPHSPAPDTVVPVQPAGASSTVDALTDHPMQSGGDTDVIARQTSLPDAATLARVQAGTGTVVPWDARGGRGGAGQGGVVYGVHKVRGRDLHKNLVSMAGRAGQYLAAVDAVSRERKGAGKALRRAGSTPALAGDGVKAPAAAMLVVAKQSGAPGASGGAASATRKSHKKKAASLNTPLLQDGAGADEGGEEEGEAHMESHMLSADEVTIISATLDLRSKTVLTRMTPLDKAYLLSTEDVLSDEVMSHILESSHSRVPVFANGRRDCIVGLLIVKLLIKCDPDDSTPVSSLSLGRPLVMHPATPMFDALNAFQLGRSHMAVITENVAELNAALDEGVPPPPTVRVLGLLTLEDVIEELIGEPIEDETDHMAVTGELRHMASWEGQ